MIIFITGTPGTGKSTISRLLSQKLSATLIDLNQLVEDEQLYTGIHPDWGFKIVDLDAICYRIGQIIKNFKDTDGLVIVEGHLSHFCKEADVVIVLRAHPSVLEGRLQDKGFDTAKIRENIEAEALDVCSFEAFQIHGEKANEIDTSLKSLQELVDLIIKVIKGEKRFPVGKADFLDYLNQE